MDINTMMESTGEVILQNVDSKPIMLELQRNWVCATDRLGYVTRFIAVSNLDSAGVFDAYDGGDFLVVASSDQTTKLRQ